MIAIGGTNIVKAYLGSTELKNIAIGDELLLSSGPLFDAEIEYLESTGTQIIETNVIFKSNLHITADALYTDDFSSAQILFGPSGDGGCWCGNVATKQWGIKTPGTGDSSVKTRVEVYYNSRQTLLYLDGVSKASQNRSVTPQNPIAIFDRYVQGRKSKAKLYYFLIQDGDNKVFEGIPVRKGQVGFLYDTVSGKLFGNAGTGDFILGNDVT